LTSQRNVLVTFLASPSDLQDERARIKEVVARVNKVFGKTTGWQIELRGWEESLPGFRRPQDIINREVDECDLFIGMLANRWGTPTGDYTSGFEEEFNRARSRTLEQDSPNIWLLFRRHDPERLHDPGPDLKKVIAFKENQIGRNELLFKEFDDAEHFSELVHDMFVEFLLDLSHERAAEANGPTSIQPPAQVAGSEIEHVDQLDADSEGETQLAALLQRISAELSAHKEVFDIELDDRARLLTAATSWFSSRHASELLGIHELHIAFRNRHTWRLTAPERLLLFRTMAADNHDLHPGWYWLQQQEHVSIPDFIEYLVIHDSKTEVRRGAIAMCARLGIKFSRSLIERLLGDPEEDVVREAIRLVPSLGDAASETLLTPILKHVNSSIRDAASVAYYGLKFKRDSAGAVREFINGGGHPASWLSKSLADNSIPLDPTFVKHLLGRSEPHIRIFAAQWLKRTAALDRSAWQQLLGDPEGSVRNIAAEALIDLGDSFNRAQLNELFPAPIYGKGAGLLLANFGSIREKDNLMIRQLRRLPDEVLIQNLDFYDADGPATYGIIAERNFTLIEPQIRNDLQSEFLSLKQNSDDQIRSALGDAADSTLSRWTPDLIESIQNDFVAVALKHLANNARPEDVIIGRRFITRTHAPDVVNGASRVLAAVGESEDAELLLASRAALGGNDLIEATQIALNLSKDKLNTFARILNEGSGVRVCKLLYPFLVSLPEHQIVELATNLLSNDNQKVRILGIAALTVSLSPEELEAQLDSQLSKATYFYDVITWLDRMLYAPEPFRGPYRSQLISLASP
jgi:hypothetical protein